MTNEEDKKIGGSETKGKVGVKEATPVRQAKPKKEKEEIILEPSLLEPLLTQYKELIVEHVGDQVIEEAFITRAGEHLPTMIIQLGKWLEVATLLKEHSSLAFNYVRNVSCVDYSTHMEMFYVLYSFKHSHQIAVRVKLDRDNPSVPTVSHLWEACNWNERECYDLFGVVFHNHPNLKRILLPDDWEGFPMRKDYEALDKEV